MWPRCQRRAWRARLSSTQRTDLVDEAALLGEGDERVGPEQATLGVLPAHQRLDARTIVRAEVDDRLVVQAQLAALAGAAQVGSTSSRSTAASCISAAKPRTGSCPSAWPLYIARSALRRAVGPVDRRANAMPTLAAMTTSCAVDRDGSRSAARIRRATWLGLARRVEVLEQDGELVAAEPGRGVRGPEAAPEPLGHGDQQPSPAAWPRLSFTS